MSDTDNATPPAPSLAEALMREARRNDMLQLDNAEMRKAGAVLAEAALRVISEYDGVHRLALAVANWLKAIAGEGGRSDRYDETKGREVSTIYYKATREDALSFYAPPNGERPKYVVGQRVSVSFEHRNANPQLCTASVIHASDTPSETLIGGSWPCRLFEVTGTPVAGPDGHKCGFVELRVEREIEAWRALGPNGQEIAAYIDALKGSDVVARAAVRDAARAAAWDVARVAAWDAVRDAALALCARDLITDDQFAVLYAPWEPIIPAASLGPWDTLKGRRHA